MEEGGTEQPDHKMTHLQRIMWLTVMVPLWNKRCEIQHGKDNRAEESDNLRLGNHTQWYVANIHNMLSVYDSRLETFAGTARRLDRLIN